MKFNFFKEINFFLIYKMNIIETIFNIITELYEKLENESRSLLDTYNGV